MEECEQKDLENIEATKNRNSKKNITNEGTYWTQGTQETNLDNESNNPTNHEEWNEFATLNFEKKRGYPIRHFSYVWELNSHHFEADVNAKVFCIV